MKWAVELSQYDLFYLSKTAIKAHTLAEFLAKFSSSTEEEKRVNENKESLRADKTSSGGPDLPKDIWQLRVDVA